LRARWGNANAVDPDARLPGLRLLFKENFLKERLINN
jgi:hypothetical protein